MSVNSVNQTSGVLSPIAGTPTNVISGLQNGIDQIANNTTKNLLPNKASSYHTNPRTINGVTFTINDDGSVTTSGTNTGGGDINYAINGDILFLNDCGPYILSGFPSGLSDNSYLGIYNPNIAWYASSKSNPEVTVDATLETGSYVCILLRSTYTGTYTWKPMIRPVGVDDNTYQPYAMTNSELSEKVTKRMATITTSDSSYLYGNVTLSRQLDIVEMTTRGFQNLVAGNNTGIMTLPEGYRPTETKFIDAFAPGSNEHYRFTIVNNGTVNVYCYGSVAYQSNVEFCLTYIK